MPTPRRKVQPPQDQQRPERIRTAPTQPPLEGGAYDEEGKQIEKIEDAPPPERKE